MCIIKALVGGGLFWFTGYILGDIIFKGVLTDLRWKTELEGTYTANKRGNEDALPGGYMPLFDDESAFCTKTKPANKIKNRMEPKICQFELLANRYGSKISKISCWWSMHIWLNMWRRIMVISLNT